MRIRRRATAQKNQRLDGADLVPGSRRNQDRIAGHDLAGGTIDFYQTPAGREVVDFLTQTVVMALGL